MIGFMLARQFFGSKVPFKSLVDRSCVLDSCDPRVKAYRNGRTFDQCRQEARHAAEILSAEICRTGEVSWSQVLEAAGHDEIVYKLSLKYLRKAGYDIGNYQIPRVRPS